MPEVKLEEVRRFMEQILMAVDVPESEARAHADLLLHADSVGHKSHGLNRLSKFVISFHLLQMNHAKVCNLYTKLCIID